MSNGLEMMLSTEVELLQAENARLNNEVVKLREELALSRDLRRSQAQVNGDLSEQLAKEQNKLEMAEAVIAGDGALITGLKNELAAAQATIEQMREALKRCTKFTQEDYDALALQPCPEVLNKVRAEAAMATIEWVWSKGSVIPREAYSYVKRIEQGGA